MNLNELIQQPGATIVDVREPFELFLGKVPGSINIPLGKVTNRVEEFKSMGKPVILCCASGNRSGQAARYLNSLGLKHVYNGGAWHQVKSALKQVK